MKEYSEPRITRNTRKEDMRFPIANRLTAACHTGMKSNLIYSEESYKIIGACFEVHKEKGCGFLEPVYQECMEIELGIQSIPFIAQPGLALSYKGRPLTSRYIPDFICFGKIVVELKAVADLADEHRAQVYNYLKATGYKLGLLINFGHYPKIEIERVVAEKGRYRNESALNLTGI